jgi:hypothetical protein
MAVRLLQWHREGSPPCPSGLRGVRVLKSSKSGRSLLIRSLLIRSDLVRKTRKSEDVSFCPVGRVLKWLWMQQGRWDQLGGVALHILKQSGTRSPTSSGLILLLRNLMKNCLRN